MTTLALSKTENNELVPADVAPMDLQSALAGDLSRLTPDGRLKYYGAICQTTGLNPLTKPFDWLTLNSKLILYANKGCAEQLRKLHGVSTDILDRKVENGVLIVRVKVTDAKGRYDEALGAVPFADNMVPDAKANAMMKAETKAKRRATLSLCGLGLLDESELDTVQERNRPIVVALNGEESASARAEKLNRALIEGEKEKAITISQEQPALVGRGVQPPVAATAPAAESHTSNPMVQAPSQGPASGSNVSVAPEPAGSASGHLATVADDKVNAPEQAATGSSTPSPGHQGEDFSFDGDRQDARPTSEAEALARELELVFADNKNCIGYIMSQGKLKPEASLETIDPVYAKKILANAKGFLRAVDAWAKTAKR